jgi:hypothetical protein
MKDLGAAQKAAALDNSVPLDVYRWSEYPEVNEAVNAIHEELKQKAGLDGREKIKKKHLKVVILNLWATWLADKSRYIAYSRTKNDYQANSRYNCLHISYATVPVVDALESCGYLEHHKGYFDRAIGVGRQSRMRATEKLIELIEKGYKVPTEAIRHHQEAECIVLRNVDNDKNVDIEYEDTEETMRMRNALRAYNECLASADIALPNAPAGGIPNTSGSGVIKVDTTKKFVRRIFNNGSWEEGGRFHGGWWQRIPWEWRVQISIDQSKDGLVEVDYSGHHIALLYGLQGIDYWGEDLGDPYEIDGMPPTEQMRSLLKLILLITINAKDRKTALAAVRQEINFSREEFGWIRESQLELETVLDSFVERHAPIKDFFFSGYGVKLQRIDSQIAETIINQFTRKSVPVLSVHDSFLVLPDFREELIDVMHAAVKNTIATKSAGEMFDITPCLKVKTIGDILKQVPSKSIGMSNDNDRWLDSNSRVETTARRYPVEIRKVAVYIG